MEIALSSDPGTDIGSDVTSGVESISSSVGYGTVANAETEEGLCVCGCGGNSSVPWHRQGATYPFHG